MYKGESRVLSFVFQDRDFEVFVNDKRELAIFQNGQDCNFDESWVAIPKEDFDIIVKFFNEETSE